ncbi:MAG: TlpA family protein disulfide reductase [Limisphaerales bacterium]
MNAVSVIVRFRGLLALVVFGALLASAAAQPIKLPELKVGSRTYRNVTVLGYNETDLYFTHSGGISNVKLRLLPEELQKRFEFDPRTAEIAERRQAEDNARFNQQVEQAVVDDHERRRLAARRAELIHEASLADPLVEKSAIGQKLPEWKAERWIGAKPDPRDRAQVIFCWAPWSLASRKFLPAMNTLHEKLGAEAVFISLVSEPGADPEAEAGVRADFATAIDSSAQLVKKLGLTELPVAIVVDARGVIRYVGHPAALNEKSLKELLTKFAQ